VRRWRGILYGRAVFVTLLKKSARMAQETIAVVAII
jgi:hypothetical protein